MPAQKRFDNQITTPCSTELKTDLITIKEELGLSDLTDLVRRVLTDFVVAYYKRQPDRSQGVPAVARSAVLGGGARTTASIRNVNSVIERLSGKIDFSSEATSIPQDMIDNQATPPEETNE